MTVTANTMESQFLQTALSWEDLQLHTKTERKVDRLKKVLLKNPSNRSALFTSPSGTGKTLTTVLLGKTLGMKVVYLNASWLISKYIGETEKNLSTLFEKAENKEWILFFDEADAIFGKRTEIKDAHDKYANQEVSYLLKCMQAFKGLVVVSLNQRKLASNAFKDRFDICIHFKRV